MGLCPFGFLDSKLQLSEPQFCHIPSVLGSSCSPSFMQKNIWTLGIDPTIEKVILLSRFLVLREQWTMLVLQRFGLMEGL